MHSYITYDIVNKILGYVYIVLSFHIFCSLNMIQDATILYLEYRNYIENGQGNNYTS